MFSLIWIKVKPITSVKVHSFNFFRPRSFFGSDQRGEVLDSRLIASNNLPLAETHEVATATNDHLAILSCHSNGGNCGYNGGWGYHGHSTLLHVLQELAATKDEHFTTVAKACCDGEYLHEGDYNKHYAAGFDHSGSYWVYHGIGFPHGSYDFTLGLSPSL